MVIGRPAHVRIDGREIRAERDSIASVCAVTQLVRLQRRIGPLTQVMVTRKEHLGVGVLGIDAYEIACVEIVCVWNGVGRPNGNSSAESGGNRACSIAFGGTHDNPRGT